MGKNTKMNAAALEAQRKEKRNAKIITACVIVAAVLIIGLAVFSLVKDSGIILRNSVAVETENFKVDSAMMTYMYTANYMNYYSYLSMLGVDSSKSLKDQECTFMGEEGGTWFDYLVSLTKQQLNELLPLCEAAHAAGVTLDADDQATIDANIATIKEEAATYGYTNIDAYLKAMTGNAIKIDDVRRCLELSALATKYSTQYLEGLTYTADELAAYRDENNDTFLGVDLYAYTLNASDFSLEDSSDAESLNDIAKAEADKLAAVDNLKDFTAAIRGYIDDKTTINSNETEEEFEARKAGLVEDALQKHVVKADLTEDIAEWAFEADLYDTYVAEGSAKYTVYMLVSDGYYDESTSRDVRHILFTDDTYEDDTKAQEVFAELEAAGFTVEAFTTLAAEHSEDPGSVDNGGLYENVFEGDMVTEFDAWLFDESREVGDCEVIKAADTGWHIIYYAGEGDQLLWEAEAEAGLKSDAYTALVEQYGEGLTYNDSAINKIDA